ncbi:Impact-like_protein [Hexamita inflata]|uniref:Impact-like protein n=1 Tax=Hexamita inflata TaxID=28002 RepID=A0AA86NCP2_9EUKA|nr:Impact-like protein [Hexamita inflata]
MQLNEEVEYLQSIYPDVVSVCADSELQLIIVSDSARSRITLDLNQYPDSFECSFVSSVLQFDIQEEIKAQLEGSLSQHVTTLIQLIQSAHDQLSSEQPVVEHTPVKQTKLFKQPVPVRYARCSPEPFFSTIRNKEIKIIRTEPLLISKSVFITVSVQVNSLEEVNEFISFINESKEFHDSTHNMAVWRVKCQNGIEEGYDEDGEKSAGSRMMFLMNKMGVVNRVAICARFWGGVLLGPGRFKIINENVKDNFILCGKELEIQ